MPLHLAPVGIVNGAPPLPPLAALELAPPAVVLLPPPELFLLELLPQAAPMRARPATATRGSPHLADLHVSVSPSARTTSSGCWIARR